MKRSNKSKFVKKKIYDSIRLLFVKWKRGVMKNNKKRKMLMFRIRTFGNNNIK